jgi:hypothetical protein
VSHVTYRRYVGYTYELRALEKSTSAGEYYGTVPLVDSFSPSKVYVV